MKTSYHLVDNQSPRLLNYKTSIDNNADATQYYYSYSYHYPWVKKPNNIIMQYILKEDDSLTLLENELQIKKEERIHIFNLSEIRKVNIEFKYLIIPLIVGGIVLSLSLLGIFSAIVEKWAGMLFVTIGFILLYLGIKGAYQLSVTTISHTFSFFLDEKDNKLNVFVQDLNNVIIKHAFR